MARLMVRMGWVVSALALVAALDGLFLIATGHRPRDPLHILYGGLIVVTVPAGAALARRLPSRAGFYHAAAGLLLLGISYRLLTTG